MGDQYLLAQPRGDRRRSVTHMDHERAAADRGAVDPSRDEAEIMRDGHRRLAGGRDAVDSVPMTPAQSDAIPAQ
jgi:hypothetical protein